MTDDVFDEWKRNKFIIVSKDLLDDNEILIILTDIQFWAEHEVELFEWCEERKANNVGMTVVFEDEITLMEFVLRWS